MEYTVFYVGGERDGETLYVTESEIEAIAFARKYSKEHEDEFNPVWGGVGIVDKEGNPIEW